MQGYYKTVFSIRPFRKKNDVVRYVEKYSVVLKNFQREPAPSRNILFPYTRNSPP